jgi:hypothetical protein
MSVLGQLIKDRAAWASSMDKENKQKKDSARQRSRTGIICAGILAVVAILVMFNHSLIITGLSKLMGRYL